MMVRLLGPLTVAVLLQAAAGCSAGTSDDKSGNSETGVTRDASGRIDPAILAEALMRDFTKENSSSFVTVSQCKVEGMRFECLGKGNKTFTITGEVQPGGPYIATISIDREAFPGMYPPDTGGRGVDLVRLAQSVAQRAKEAGVVDVKPEEAKCTVSVTTDRGYGCLLPGRVFVTVAENSTYKAEFSPPERGPGSDQIQRSFEGTLK